MKSYLVGGAVRDALLGLPVKDRDWVVVGATPQQMLDAGYQQVGRDFPVFLHPQSREEYAPGPHRAQIRRGLYRFYLLCRPGRHPRSRSAAPRPDGQRPRPRMPTAQLSTPTADRTISVSACCAMSLPRLVKIRCACCASRALPPATPTSVFALPKRLRP